MNTYIVIVKVPCELCSGHSFQIVVVAPDGADAAGLALLAFNKKEAQLVKVEILTPGTEGVAKVLGRTGC